jgi:hypothetical protein
VSNAWLLELIAADMGLEVEDMLEEATYDSIAPGICTKCRAVTDCCEPDADANWCDECHGNSVKSCLVLAGVL